jgi:NAD+ diphosphatase
VTGFTGARLDRADRRRTDEAWLDAARQDPRARVLELEGLDPRLDAEGRLRWRGVHELDPQAELLLLGLDENSPCFVELQPAAGRGGNPMAVMHLLHLIPAHELALYGGARSLVDWHQRHGFCARCGAGTAVFRAGWGRRCAACKAEHFPRVDPVVIMLAEHDGRVLLGRQAHFPPRMYSALAGFVEPGESIEEAVARELHEEAGVRVQSVRYVLSQPWPFPSSLMLGCVAPVMGATLTLDTNEIQEAIWLSRSEVHAVLAGTTDAPCTAPPPVAIAHSLLRNWVECG